jgi:hypothetical protein
MKPLAARAAKLGGNHSRHVSCGFAKRGKGRLWNVTPSLALSFVRVPPMEELMRKLIVTTAAGLLLTFSAASVDAAAGKAHPRSIEGRAAFVVPMPPVLYRFNDFGPDYGAPDPFAGKAG